MPATPKPAAERAGLPQKGRVMVGSWSGHGRVMVGSWSGHGRVMVGSWSGQQPPTPGGGSCSGESGVPPGTPISVSVSGGSSGRRPVGVGAGCQGSRLGALAAARHPSYGGSFGVVAGWGVAPAVRPVGMGSWLGGSWLGGAPAARPVGG